MSNDMKLIMENWRKTVKENSMQAGGVQVAPATQQKPKAKPKKNPKKGMRGVPYKTKPTDYDDPTHLIDEDNYEDSGEPWDPKSSSYPFQHPQKGLLLRTRNRANFNVWADRWKKENPDGQLTKAVRVAPKGEPGDAIKRMSGFMKRGLREEEELMEGFMDTLKKGAIAGGLALGMAGTPATAYADTPTGGEQTTQQAQAEQDSTTVTVGFLHAYAKHLKNKPGVDVRDRHAITMKWLPIQKAVYDLGPEAALSSDSLDNDQQELLQLVLKQVDGLDAEMLQYYGQIGSGITMNESVT